MTYRFKQVLIDSHCHLDFPVFDDDRSSILKVCSEQKISAIVVPGVCCKDWQRVLNLCDSQEMLFPALGLHPCFIDQHHKNDLDKLVKICDSKHLLAIGEIGLDFFRKDANTNKTTQQYFFSEQLQIAGQYQLPVLIHARKSHDIVIKYLKSSRIASSSAAGIIHAYSGSYEQAKEYIKLGFKLGFGGAFSYPNATKLRSLLAKLPIDAWVLETDAPDMSPIAHHGQRNSPQYLNEIAKTFIQLSDTESQQHQIIEQLYQNTLAVFPGGDLPGIAQE